ncbi:cupin [Catellatospora sp. TT07R-123]|uniref:cupin domain-containing protein n=1 Tax=Catellatospora sp. TT07R-123 TaxID=2733863 RepID=UPI001AFD1177|nr:cupin domain-containing protein [Catellatospora sp. TT07R-123]GHJ43856.1 cupin [Catellatospora sp. TT07R-123]
MTDLATPARAGFHPADSIEGVTMGTGSTARFIAPGTATQGRFGLFEWVAAPRTGATDAHLHKTFSESFYVTSGELTLYDGAHWITARSGDFLHVPEGVAHGFRNDTDELASMLVLFAPAPPREAFFRELAEIGASGRTLSEEEWIEFWARHDQYQVKLG